MRYPHHSRPGNRRPIPAPSSPTMRPNRPVTESSRPATAHFRPRECPVWSPSKRRRRAAMDREESAFEPQYFCRRTRHMRTALPILYRFGHKTAQAQPIERIAHFHDRHGPEPTTRTFIRRGPARPSRAAADRLEANFLAEMLKAAKFGEAAPPPPPGVRRPASAKTSSLRSCATLSPTRWSPQVELGLRRAAVPKPCREAGRWALTKSG